MSLNITLPVFNHPEVAVFYEQDLSISKAEVEQILALPRATLIADMETIIIDFIQRQEYFKAHEKEGFWCSFHFHALWVLAELKAVEALPTILKILEQDNDFSWYWFSDYTTENLWQIYYQLGENQLEELKTALLAPGEWIFRIVPSNVVEQIYFHQPEREREILDWYHAVLDAFLDMEDDDPALDSEVISTTISDLLSLPSEELLPKIKALYDKGAVYGGMAGDYKSVEKDIKKGGFSYRKRALKNSIYDRYEDAMKWNGYQMKYGEAHQEKHTYKPVTSSSSSSKRTNVASTQVTTIKRKGKKVGRNEPCPCGSGKKYKKCCLRK